MSSPYFAGQLPRILAHRGLALRVPENTLAAFAAAVDAGADYVETDAHATADGVPVLAHDPVVIDRGRPVEIATTTWEQLASVDLGAGHRVPRLDEALAALGAVRLNIDVKAAGAAAPVARAIEEVGALDRVLVTSFDGATRRRVVAALPGVATSASSDLIARALVPAHLARSGRLRTVLAGVPCVQVPEHHRGIPIVTRRTVRAFHEAGVEVHVWTVNNPAEMVRLSALGVDGIVTDRCDLALEAVRP
ncbi:glycerophosphodiester phosphodiesterase family protein [Labedella populi]|uniref:glycerophosphodiester phosphodiesterase family protein n=1 Tax=Labedella populi TaxID=2498850 RepID=UPI001FB6DF05|nr:glycerophosphodiester phosphodiesterase family protein [Labedella populi]